MNSMGGRSSNFLEKTVFFNGMLSKSGDIRESQAVEVPVRFT